jgi:anti-sigma B factor antagonist
MSEKSRATIRPGKISITKMLAEIESTRKQATKHWLLALLLPFLVGIGFLTYTSREISMRLQKIRELNNEIAQKQKIIEDQAASVQRTVNALNATDADPEAKQAIINTSPAKPNTATMPRVVIHIDDEGQRSKASEVAQALKRSGYAVRPIERGSEKVDSNQVEFREEDRKAAKWVVSILKDQGLSDVKLVSEQSAQSGQIKISFAPPKRPPLQLGGLRINVTKATGDITILRLHGEVADDGVSDLRAALASLRQQGHLKILVDLGDVSKLDNQGLQALVSEYTALNRAGGQLKLLNVSGKLTDLLTITKLLTVFDTYDDEAQAISSF